MFPTIKKIKLIGWLIDRKWKQRLSTLLQFNNEVSLMAAEKDVTPLSVQLRVHNIKIFMQIFMGSCIVFPCITLCSHSRKESSKRPIMCEYSWFKKQYPIASGMLFCHSVTCYSIQSLTFLLPTHTHTLKQPLPTDHCYSYNFFCTHSASTRQQNFFMQAFQLMR